MSRLTLACAIVIFAAISASSQIVYTVPMSQPPTDAGAPALCPTGVVTFLTPHGQFYTNIGAVEQLDEGAQLLILRQNQVIAQATVVDVDQLDSIGELHPEFCTLQLRAGDQVAVQANPCCGVGQDNEVDTFDLVTVAGKPVRACVDVPANRLPLIEPDMSHKDAELFLAVFTAVMVGITIANSN